MEQVSLLNELFKAHEQLQEVSKSITDADRVFAAIDAESDIQRKVEVFKESSFYEAYQRLERESFSDTEREQITVLNQKLNSGYKYLQPFLGSKLIHSSTESNKIVDAEKTRGGILDFIEAHLAQRIPFPAEQKTAEQTLNPKVEMEINHIKSVLTLSFTLNSNNILGIFATLLHDFNKYGSNGKMQLGLHELASVDTGEKMTVAILKSVQSELHLTDTEITLAGRVVARAIFTHGSYEYPEFASQEYPVPSQNDTFLYLLWGNQLYPRPNLRSIPSTSIQQQKFDLLQETITSLNVADILVGCDLYSIAKYDIYETRILNENSFENYIKNYIFKSFPTNIASPAVEYIRANGDSTIVDHLDTLIQSYKDSASFFLYTLGIDPKSIIPDAKNREDLEKKFPLIGDILESVVSAKKQVLEDFESIKTAENEESKTKARNAFNLHFKEYAYLIFEHVQSSGAYI